jgi:hypothetical protein
MQAHRPASSLLCMLPAKLDEDHPRRFSSAAFRISSTARNAPFAVSRVNQNSVNQHQWEQALIAACKAESLPSTVLTPYNVRNRTSMTQSRSIIVFSK